LVIYHIQKPISSLMYYATKGKMNRIKDHSQYNLYSIKYRFSDNLNIAHI